MSLRIRSARPCRGEPRALRATRALAVVACLLCCAPAAPAAPPAESYVWSLPRGFPLPYVPPDNPMSTAKVALGRRLFFEPRISVTGRHHCGSCHEPTLAYTDGRGTARGATGGDVGRATLSLANVAYLRSYGWFDAGVTTLEAQMRTPLYSEHPVELGLAGREREVLASLADEPAYASAFATAFPGDTAPLTVDNLIRAIAAFERTLLSGGSPFDRYVFHGEHAALDPPAKAGMRLFYSDRLACASCHGGFAFTGGVRDAARPDVPAVLARNGIGDRPTRIPTLRNVALTAPYMHDGRHATLADVLAHYERGGAPELRSFTLTSDERVALLAFLEALTDAAFVVPPL